MKRLILPVALSLAGLAAGAALGLVLRPAPPEEAPADAQHAAADAGGGAARDPAIPRE